MTSRLRNCCHRGRTVCRAVVAAVVLTCGIVGCQSGGGLRTEVDYRQRAQRLPLGDATLAAVRLEPERLGEQLAAAGELRDAVLEEETEEIPDLEHAASRIVGALLDGRSPSAAWRRAPDRSFALEELDAERPVYIAITELGNRELFRRLSTGYPYDEASAIRNGVALRLHVPSSKPEQLVAELRDHCRKGSEEWLGGRCSAVARIRTTGGFATVDLLVGADADQVEAHGKNLGDSVGKGSYPERLTPAAKAFVGRRAGMAAYVESRDIWKLVVLKRRQNLFGQLAELAPDARNSTFPLVLDRLYDEAALAAPAAREFEDMAFVYRHGAEGETIADVVQTYTEQGKEVAEASRNDAKLSTVALEEASVRFEYAVDVERAVGSAKIPRAFELDEQMPVSGRTGSYIPVTAGAIGMVGLYAQMPTAMPFARISVFESAELGWGSLAKRLTGIRAVRASLGIHPDRQNPYGFTPVGGVAVAYSPESNIGAVLRAGAAILRYAGFTVRTAREREDGVERMRVALGRSMEIFGKPSPVASRATGRADFAALAEKIDRSGETSSRFADQLRRYESIGSLEFEHRSTEAGRILRLSAGAESSSAPRVPPFDGELRAPDPSPRCRLDAVRLSKVLVASGARGPGAQGRPSLLDYRRVLPTLAGAAEGCGEGTDWGARLERAVAIHRHRYGRTLEDFGFWAQGEASHRRACEQGLDRACSRVEAIERRSSTLRVPNLGRAVVPDIDPPGPGIAVSTDGVYVGASRIARAAQFQGSGVDPGSVVGELDERLVPSRAKYELDEWAIVPVAVDPTVSVRRFGRVAAAASSISGGEATDASVSTLGVWVRQRPAGDVIGDPVLELLPMTTPELADVPDRFEFGVEIRNRGFVVRGPDGVVESIDACPSEGPTVCLDGDRESVRGLLETYRDAESADAARRAAENIAAAYSYRRLHRVIASLVPRAADWRIRPRQLRLHVSADQPFGLVLRTSASLGRTREQDYESDRELFDDLERREAMFDRFVVDVREREEQ